MEEAPSWVMSENMLTKPMRMIKAKAEVEAILFIVFSRTAVNRATCLSVVYYSTGTWA